MDRTISRRRFLAGGLGTALAWLGVGRPAAADERILVEAICRSAWGAEKPRSGRVEHTIRRITVHHSAVKLTDNRRAPARFRGHQRAHFGNGWPDIAYHILIDRHGHVYRGRNPRYRGDTGTNYDPTGHLLVMCEGNFDEQGPSRSQVRSLVAVLAWATERYDVPVDRIRSHRHHAATACPGSRLHAKIADGTIHRRVRSRRGRGGVTLGKVCGDRGRRLVRRIERGDA